MDGRWFLDVARELANGPTEAHWRAAAGRAYYALLLEGLASLNRWGFPPTPRENIHSFVRLRFTYTSDSDLRGIGVVLDDLVRLRNQADYQLAAHPRFASPRRALQAITDARDAVDLLDRIDADPPRRAAAIASIRP